MPVEANRPRRLPLLVGAAALVAAAMSGWIYVSVAGIGNLAGSVDPACTNAATVAAALAPLARGEVAAFQVAETPRLLTDIAFRDPAGAEVSLGDFGGKVVLVNLWATWCVPCREEMPALERLAQTESGDDGFLVLPINLDLGDPALASRFLADIGAEALPLYADPEWTTVNTLKHRGLIRGGLPTTIALDPAGCTLGLLEGPAEWDSPDARALLAAARRTPEA